MTILELLTGCWAIQPEKLREIQAIYKAHLRGEQLDIGAIEARLGRPLANEQQDYTVENGGIAVLRLAGIMAPKATLFMRVSGGISTQQATLQLEGALADPRVRGVIVSMDTPGGNVIGVSEFAAAIFDMARQKPIVMHSDGALCSAGYWAGAAANAVYLSGPVVQAGSIGVVIDRTYNPTDPVKEESIVAGKYKRLGNSGEPLSKEARAVVKADVDYVYSLMVDDVAKYRGTTAEQVLDRMAEGRVFRGQQAIDAGLVDGLSTLDALVEQMATKPDAFAKRRKAVFALASPLSTAAASAAPEDETSPSDKGTAMSDPITRESFERDHAPLFAQLKTEFTAQGLAQGAAQERERIQAVRATSMPGHEQLVEQLAFDGKTSAGDAALKVLAADRAKTTAAVTAHVNDAPPAAPVAAAPSDTTGTETDRSVGKRAAAAFNRLRGITA